MMRALILVLIWTVGSAAQSASTGLFNEANAAYRNGNFAAASSAYMQVVESGVKDARLFYNLANAHFKSGRLAEAILWYERALQLSPRDDDIEANLRFAHQVKKDRDPPPEGNAVSVFLADLFFLPTLSELSLLFALGWMGLFALASWRLWTGHATSLLIAGLVLCGGGAAVGGGWLATRAYQQAHDVSAIAMAEVVTAYSGPDSAQTEVFVMHEGTKVRVVRREGEWALVRLLNGLGGWVQAEQIEEI